MHYQLDLACILKFLNTYILQLWLMYLHALCVLLFLFSVSGCVDVPIAAGAAAASFIGGVLLTTAIAAAVAGAIMCRAKRKVNHNLVHT